MMLTNKELNGLKREVKNVTGRNMKDVDIEAFGPIFITFTYYANNYDKATNNKTRETIER